MRLLTLRVLEREPQFMRSAGYVRAGLRVAPLLREHMAEGGYTAKELAVQTERWALGDPKHRKALDYRTIQHAMEGSCELDTFFALAGFFGWDFSEILMTPVIGADPIVAREREHEQMVTAAAALNARLERDRAARARLGGVAEVSGLRGVSESRKPRTADHQAPQGA